MKSAILAAAALAALSATPASAVTYLFNLSYSTHSATGFLTTATPATAAITGISGTFDGFAITGLSAFAGASNILYASYPFFDLGGMSFTANAVTYNVFSNGGIASILNDVDSPCGCNNFVPLRTLTVTAVPEPASWALMIAGFGMVGVSLRRRKAVAA